MKNENAKICYLCQEKFENNYLKDKKYCQVRGRYRGVVHTIRNFKYGVSKTIPVAFYNGSNYGYHFIIKELAEEFKNQFIFLGESIEKYVTFTASIE